MVACRVTGGVGAVSSCCSEHATCCQPLLAHPRIHTRSAFFLTPSLPGFPALASMIWDARHATTAPLRALLDDAAALFPAFCRPLLQLLAALAQGPAGAANSLQVGRLGGGGGESRAAVRGQWWAWAGGWQGEGACLGVALACEQPEPAWQYE